MEEAPSGHVSQLVVRAMRCQNTLKDRLSNCEQNDLGHQESDFLSAQSARLDSWCFKTGIYKSGQHSLDYHLKDLPETRIIIAKLLDELSLCLQKLREPESTDEHPTSKMQSQQKCDEDSERSRDSLPVSHDRHTHVQPNRKWTRIANNIHELYMQARLTELDEENNMQTRIERFKNEPGQKQIYESSKRMAREKVGHQFPRSPPWMQERIAELFARRRIRFEYLKHHQGKHACGLHHESPPQPQNDPAGTTSTPFPETDTQVNKSDTFMCPSCFLVIPSTEAEGISSSQHVMRDLEPYFCVFEDCSKPFEVHNSFEGVLIHMHESHVAVPFDGVLSDGPNRKFKNRDLFEQFFEQEWHLPRSQSDTLVGIFRRKYGFQFTTCHFCGCYPEKFRNCFRPDIPFAQEEMRKHIKQHMEEIALYLLPFMDGVVDDAPGEDNSDHAVGTQRRSDELSIVIWRTTLQQERRDSQDQMESTNTVDGQLQSDFEMEGQLNHPGEKNHGLEGSKENKDGDK